MDTNNSFNKRQRTDADTAKNDKSYSNSNERYFIISSIVEGALKKISPFALHRVLRFLAGEVASVKRLRDGSILVETKDEKQAAKLKTATMFHDVAVKVEAHRTLNFVEGVVFSYDLMGISEEEILDELKEQGVVGVRRIKSRRDGILMDTPNLVLKFAKTSLPEKIIAGYLSLPIRVYIPNPMRCYKCQKFGHTSSRCSDIEKCGRCGGNKHEGHCLTATKCVNCSGEHPAWSSGCPMFREERAVQQIKVTKKISYAEAKKELKATSPQMKGPSYATVAARAVETREMGTQTHLPPVCSPCKTILTSNTPGLKTPAAESSKSSPAIRTRKSRPTSPPERATSMSLSETEDISEGELANKILAFKNKKKGSRTRIAR